MTTSDDILQPENKVFGIPRSLIILIITLLIVNVSITQPEISYEQGHILTVDNHQIYYEKFGDGPDIILIPGGMYNQLAN